MEDRKPAATWNVVRLMPRHVEAAVRIHCRAFPGFFLSFLGPRLLREFYSSFHTDPAGIGFVAEDESGRLLGVVVGALVPEGFFGRLVKRRWWALGAACLGSFLRRPSIAPRLVRALFYRGDPPAARPRSLLSSLCVAPEVQGQGIGSALVRAWLDEVRSRGSTGCYLTTDADNNEAVNHFYQRVGWTLESSFQTPEGRRMHRYVWDFDANGKKEELRAACSDCTPPAPRPNLVGAYVKRLFDVLVSATLLLLLAPLMALVAWLVKATSPGPVLFRQERVGRRFRRFLIYKFRTMVEDAPKRGGQITCGEDPRITRVGRLLRKTKLDELPQLINVLKGEMSLVGPRPEVPRYVEMFREDYEEILRLRPGITDPASLLYRDESAILGQADDPEQEYVRRILPEKIALAKRYVREQSLRKDVAVILATLTTLISDRIRAVAGWVFRPVRDSAGKPSYVTPHKE